MKVTTATAQPILSRMPAAPAQSQPVAADRVELGQKKEEPPLKKWTILQYSAADNDLYRYMIDDLDEAEVVGSTDTMNIVAQVDHGGSQGAQRLHIATDSREGLNSPVVQELGDTDMANPQTLADFIEWGVKNYPAQNYMVIISDHGDGWNGACQDYSAGTWMSLPQIQEGLQKAREATGRKIDVLGFDACLMASTEVAHQLKNEADFLVASEETESATGWPYTRLLNPEMLLTFAQALSTQLNMSPRELAEHVVRTAQKDVDSLPTMSAIDMSKVDGLVRATDELGKALQNTSGNAATLQELAQDTQSFSGYKDLYDFADRLRGSWKVFDWKVKWRAHQVMQATRDAVIAEQHSPDYPNAHGITIELSNTSGAYQNVKFAQDTHWDEAVARMQGQE